MAITAEKEAPKEKKEKRKSVRTRTEKEPYTNVKAESLKGGGQGN